MFSDIENDRFVSNNGLFKIHLCFQNGLNEGYPDEPDVVVLCLPSCPSCHRCLGSYCCSWL